MELVQYKCMYVLVMYFNVDHLFLFFYTFNLYCPLSEIKDYYTVYVLYRILFQSDITYLVIDILKVIPNRHHNIMYSYTVSRALCLVSCVLCPVSFVIYPLSFLLCLVFFVSCKLYHVFCNVL